MRHFVPSAFSPMPVLAGDGSGSRSPEPEQQENHKEIHKERPQENFEELSGNLLPVLHPLQLAALVRRESAPSPSTFSASRRPSVSVSEAGYSARQNRHQETKTKNQAAVRLIERPLSSNKFATSSQFAALKDIAGATPLPFPESPCWTELLQGTVPTVHTIQDAYDLEKAMDTHGRSMVENYSITNNFSTLVLILLTHMRRMRNHAYEGLRMWLANQNQKDEDMERALTQPVDVPPTLMDWPQEAQNAIFGVRVFTKYFVEQTPRKQLFDIFEHDKSASTSKESLDGSTEGIQDPRDSVSVTDSTPRSSQLSRRASVIYNGRAIAIDSHVLMDKRKRSIALLEELLHVIIFANIKSTANYDFYIETLNLMLVLLSGQMTRAAIEPTENDHFLVLVLDRLGHFAKGALSRLIDNFIQQPTRPTNSTGVFYNAYSYLFPPKVDATKSSVMADKSVMLMLVLISQGGHMYPNNFRDALSVLVDSGGANSMQTSLLADISDTNVFELSFKDIHDTIVKHLQRDETCLLLYTLLLKNREFRLYVLSRTDPDILVLPLLRIIYEAVDRRTNYSLLYTLLTVLLILSQDDVYNQSSHKVDITPPQWFTERIVRSISLGGLIILVLVRVVQANMSRHRDLYFHTTSLAVLANMSSTICGMHAVVAQRIVNLYETVSKKYLKLSSKLPTGTDAPSDLLLMHTANSGDGDNDDDGGIIVHPMDTKTSLDIELSICSDILALLLEIINSILTHTLKSNPHLLYAILHRRDMFMQFRLYTRFGDLIRNIDTAIAFFHGRLLEADVRTPTPETVLKVIEEALVRWMPTKLQSMPDIKFQYEEEAEYQRFFVPYVWSMVYQHSLIYWDVGKAQLLREIDPNFPATDLTVPM